MSSEMFGGSYASARDKRFRNAFPACVLLRKNFRDGVPARFVTKIPLDITKVSHSLNALERGRLYP
jgi:hypothetical protein